MDSNLLKEAIADAKAVRQTALANAKVALEEAFSERYQAMFAEKLKEDAEVGNPIQAPNEEEEEGVNTPEENVSEQEIDELIKELEAEVGQEPHAEPDGDEPQGTAPQPGLGQPPVAPQPGIGQLPQGLGQPACPPTMPTAPGVPSVPSVGGEVSPTPIAQPGVPPVGGEVPPSPEGQQQPPPPPSDVPPTGGEETDEDVDLNELLESLKQEVEDNEEEEEEEEEEAKLDEAKKLASSGIGGNKAGGSENKKPSASASSTSGLESGGIEKEGFPTGDAKVGPEDATKATRPNKGNNATSTKFSTPSLGGSSGPALKASRPNAVTLDSTTALKENQNLKKQLNEAEDVIRYVKGQLNEVNLLNAKLLYTNKLFKEYNMNNEHKMRVVEMFDLAKNVREVKLTYANIAESLNFGGTDMKKKVVTTTNSSVQSITEGLASKPVGSTKPKDIISESAMVSKFQKLAGIKKKVISG